MYRKLLKYVGEYGKYAILAPLTIIGEVVLEVAIPFVMARIIDYGICGDGGIGYTVKMGLLMVGMACLSLALGALSGRFAAKSGMGFAKNLRRALFGKVQDFSFRNVDRFSSASLVTRLTTDVTNMQNAFMMMIRMAIRSPIMLVSAVFMAVRINPVLSLVFLVAIPVLGISIFAVMSKSYKRFENMLKKYDLLNARVQENLIAIRVVKAFVREEYENVRFQEEADAVRTAQIYAEKLVILMMPVMQIIMNLTIIAVLWIGGNMIAEGTFAIGELSSFITYITQILMSLIMLSMVFLNLVLSRASATRISQVLDEKLDIVDPEGDEGLEVSDGSIDFEDVSFSYAEGGERMSLSDINLHIKSGQTVGILGGTGSSKTTLVQLIPRLYDATKGVVKVAGRDVREYSLDTIRGAVAMVLQKNVLFSGTIRDNLKWGNPNATDEEITAACVSAQADDFIKSFPDGYDTDLGQGGVNVSGGQKQRLCIARALLKNPKILILDDSTSAVDTATEAKIRRAFNEDHAGVTTIIIAQRVTSVMECDLIVIMDEGRIVDSGTHDELLERCAIYKDVYYSQQKGVA
ncbi:MAG: ABC transporter ATP-binding protein [Clostridia bacterium]|nr:ABC transporter ATP-binding protein [Clostridia bacterium]